MIGFFAFVVIVVFGILALVGGLQWIGRSRELPEADPERLGQIESALTSLESRLDRLQDQQQFLERLLEDRPEHRSLGAGDARQSSTGEVDSILFDTDEGEEGGGR